MVPASRGCLNKFIFCSLEKVADRVAVKGRLSGPSLALIIQGVERCPNRDAAIPGRRGLALIAAMLAVVMPRSAEGSPATFVTALPVATGQLLVRFNFQTTFSNPQFFGLQTPVTIAYGLIPHLALFVNLNRSYQTLGGGPDVPALSSWAARDVAVYLRYTVLKIDRTQSIFRIPPLGGAFLPAGGNAIRGQGAYLPGSLQTGSGTVDPYLGTAVGYHSDAFGAAADATYRLNPVAGGGISPGSEFRSDAQVETRLYPRKLPEEGLPGLLEVSLEANYTRDAASYADGVLAPLSTGRTLKQDLVLEYSTLRWQIGIGGRWPLMQSFDSPTALRERFSAFLFYEYYFALPHRRHRRRDL